MPLAPMHTAGTQRAGEGRGGIAGIGATRSRNAGEHGENPSLALGEPCGIVSLNTDPLNRSRLAASIMIGPPQFCIGADAPRQNRLPPIPEGGLRPSWPGQPPTMARSCFQTGETTMTTYDHVQELRAEPSWRRRWTPASGRRSRKSWSLRARGWPRKKRCSTLRFSESSRPDRAALTDHDSRAVPVFQPAGPEPGFEGNRAQQARPERAFHIAP